MTEEERWIMHGLDREDPSCIRSADELVRYIDQVGFLPLFRSGIPGFSAEEHTASEDWFCEVPGSGGRSSPAGERSPTANSSAAGQGSFQRSIFPIL